MILKLLREQTKNAHENAEKFSLASDIISHKISLKDYEKLLTQNYKFYYITEHFLTKHKLELPFFFHQFVSTEKSDKLQSDLVSNFPEYKLEQPFPKLIDDASFEKLIGIIYVIEGSMMGSMLIQKQLPNCSLLSSIKKHHFYSLNTKAQLSKWKLFCEAIESIEFSDEQIKSCVAAAINTFKLFEKC